MAGSKIFGGRYRTEEPPIGEGGMGVVYKAFDTITKRFVAVKTVKGSVHHESIEMFQKEWTVLARLCHPNIVDILDIGELTENGQQKPYFVMPLLPGATLDKLIKNCGQRLTPERTLEIICQACRGLQAAHDQGLVHRDIKPSNLFVMQDDTVKIIDFGVVHLADAESRTGLKGTLHYIAPEQLELKPATSRSDIFSLGVVCYEALTGRKPFDGKSDDEVMEAIRSQMPLPVSELNPAVNNQINRAVHRALAKPPYHRFSSAREFSEILQRSLRGERVEIFDRSRIQPRINRVKKALKEGDYQFAIDILGELESEGNIDPEMSPLRVQAEQAIRAKMIYQLLDSARSRMEEEEYPLALQDVQRVLELEPMNIDALALKENIERQRGAAQIDKWYYIAEQHVGNKLYGKARQAVEEILKIDSSHKPARSLLAEIRRGEQETAKLSQEKQQLYDSALRAYRSGDISSALSKLERVIELGKLAPGHPNTDAQYLAFYEQIRSERDELRKSYTEGKKALQSRNFERALAICTEVLSRRPGEPLFESLKIEIEDVRRQENSSAIAHFQSRIESEPDLERKYAVLKEAVNQFPEEQMFQHSLKLLKQRRDLVNSIVSRARYYESQGQFLEAFNQWDVLRNIYSQYPGLEFELQRLTRKQEAYLRDEVKANWVERIDRALIAGDSRAAQDLVITALRETPEDGELIRMRALVEKAAETSAWARARVEEAKNLAARADYLPAIEKLRAVRKIDDKDPSLTAALTSSLVEHARVLAQREWRTALPFVEEALALNPADAGARSISLLIEEARRREQVERCLMEGRELQTRGNLKGALEKVGQGLSEFPNDMRLSQLRSTLSAALEASGSNSQKKFEMAVSERGLAAAASVDGVVRTGVPDPAVSAKVFETEVAEGGLGPSGDGANSDPAWCN
jgi:eukaryotic-like serine/threonine-protein kinase